MSWLSRIFGKKQVPISEFPTEWKKDVDTLVPFYHSLDAENKIAFEKRMMEFLDTTQITGIKTVVSDTDRILLAASAIIPIFGFPNWKYHNLHEILLYPAHFDEDFSIGSKHKAILGMVGYGYMEGKMIISQKTLHHGFSNSSDKRNTAIHEFIHLMDKSDGEVDGLPVHFMDDKTEVLPWLNLVDHKIHEIRQKKSDINPYGATNRAEFLSVAGEYFFERPDLLNKKHPELYRSLEKFFRQSLSKKDVKKKSLATRHFDPCPCGNEEKYRNCCMIA